MPAHKHTCQNTSCGATWECAHEKVHTAVCPKCSGTNTVVNH